ncbi:interferon regulatory factor 7 [Brachionichthys hirsutus]|uniref:interferon regulatory factor 7 n=1 Tax=Brachionichthys hirsutus TaxID=412623 RepID=UPI003604497D
MQSPPKPQFASWLVEQVETGQYAGLRYVDPNTFRVPWKHNSRKDCNDEDGKIFRAWAVASGKISEFPHDKARWKTNFRCALNNLKFHFKMTQDNSKNSEDPHKIYEIINRGSNVGNLTTQHQECQEDSEMTLDTYSSPIERVPSGTEHNLLNNFMALDLGNHPSEEQPWVEHYVQHDPAEVNPQLQPEQPSFHQTHPPPVVSSSLQPNLNDLEITVHYRKREMLKTRVRAPRLQLHYQEAPDLEAHPICFPSTDGLLDRKQIDFTNRILNSIQRGLLLEVRDTGIYACRLDRCHVFASTSEPSVAHPDPRKLPQNTMVELLSFEKFVNELKQFTEHSGGSPEYTINMCFGEKFPDGRALEKKLIVVKVVPLICRYFHELAQLEGASSLHSTNVSLQISYNSLYDLINAVLGLPAVDLEPAQSVICSM